MQNVLRLLLVGALLLACVGCDQVSKELVRADAPLRESHAYLGDTFRFVHVENPGAFLGVGSSLSGPVRVVLFQGLIGLLVLGLLWAAALRARTRPWQVVGFTLLASSGIGNLIDRLLYNGVVTDFLNIGVGGVRTGIFNIADVVGMVGLVVLLFAGVATTPAGESHERARET